MTGIANTSIIAVFSIITAVALICTALFAGAAGAQFFPVTPFGYGGFDGFGYPGLDGFYGSPFGMPAFGSPLMPFGLPGFSTPQVPYGAPSLAIPQVPYSMPSFAGPQTQLPISTPPYAAQQPQVPISQPVATAGTAGMFTIPGLEGLQGFMPGENKLSLAVIPVTQQNNQLGFQVIGFAISSPGSSQAVVYSLSQPLAGVIDPTQNTLQVDLSNLASSINQAGAISSDQLYNTIRSSPQVIIIDVDMAYQGAQGTQTIFSVNSVSIIPPDGRMQAFQMQQPTQLIIDSQSMRIYMVAFPQMISSFVNYYGASFPQVLPIVYAQPIPILAPIFVPFLQPFPIFFSSFVGFNPFFFGDGFVSFFNRGSFHGNFPIHDRDFGARAFSQIAGVRGIGATGIAQGIGQGGRFTQPGVGATSLANIGAQGIAQGGRFTGPSGLASARAPGVSAGSSAGPQSGIASVRAPGVSIGSSAAPATGFANVRAPGVSIGSGAGMPSFASGLQAPSGFANVRAPGASIGSSAGMPSIS
ncbi:MAG TPA: hypothetical protein VGJ92_07555, partial [Methanocella sp.]